MPGHRPPAAAEGSPLPRRRQPRSPNPSLTLLTSEKVTTNVNTVSTPVYDGDRTAALEVIPSSARRPPRHLDTVSTPVYDGDRTAALEVIPSSARRPPRHLDTVSTPVY